MNKRYIGPSSDGRTNRWMLTCPKCQHQWKPTTTMLAKRYEECPECRYGDIVDYNK